MAPTPLRRLIAVQNARVTEIELINTLIREKEPNTLNKNIVHSRIEAVNKIWSEARQAHSEIMGRDDSAEDVYVTSNEFARMQRVHDDTLDHLLTLLSNFETRSTRSRSTEGDKDSEEESRPAKLPKLDLPTFSGAYEDWASFADLFTTLVHEAPRLADVTKLQYLKSCLRGPAADVVKNVATTNANYKPTWEELKTQFCKPRLIVTQHLDSLFNISRIKNSSAADLRAFTGEAKQVVKALKNLQMPIEEWDIWLIHVLSARLDDDSQKEWESYLTDNKTQNAADPLSSFPKFAEFTTFLEKRIEALTMLAAKKANERKTLSIVKADANVRKVHHANASQSLASKSTTCALCSGPHYISKCAEFLKKPSHERKSEIRRMRLCFNCMGRHMIRECTSKGRCNACGDRHHSLLHYTVKSESNSVSELNTNGQPPRSRELVEVTPAVETDVKMHTATVSRARYYVILATARVKIVGPNGDEMQVRALLDQGAEASFVSESVAQLLELPRQPVQVALSGLGASVTGTAHATTRFEMRSIHDSGFVVKVSALILPCLTSKLPARDLREIDFEQFSQLSLADPLFQVSESIDLILGADVYGILLRTGLRRFSSSQLVAQNTALGWIVSGSIRTDTSRRAEPERPESRTIFHCASGENLHEAMQRFWVIEEIPQSAPLAKPEDEACERLFAETHTRDSNGCYIVKLPLKAEPPRVANETRRIALGSLANLHRRFLREPRLAVAYTEFMEEYVRLGHMTRVPSDDLSNPRAWYLPHHAVIQASATKWKIRVVFDGSRRTSEQYCLNDFLLAGPALQRDLFLILLNWCLYQFAFTADIVKMFRYIQTHCEDRILLRIVWSSDSGQPPIDFQMNTLTYGTSPAPYLAIRTLIQLAADERERFPMGARSLEDHTYVDDIFEGAHELSVAVQKKTELIEILGTAGFKLDKWGANHPDLLPPRDSQDQGLTKEINRDEFVKTLGLHWDPNLDEFKFSTPSFEDLAGNVTKRSVLSSIARLFDPLGWLSPITITAKILMQDLWILKCEWDSPLPADARMRWIEYCTSLSLLPTLSVKRWLGYYPGATYQLHGFSDASMRAFAAAVYLRIEGSDGHVRVSLLAAKSKVAPVKTISIPNLELCGAVLLVKLVCHLRKPKNFANLPIYAWTDNQIVLTWLNKHPCSWKTFVANRVSLIHTELPEASWGHITSTDNPADLATRGSKPNELKNSSTWWQGPPWLSLARESWPQPPAPIRVIHTQVNSAEPEILHRFSTLTRLVRVTAYCLRPLVNLRRRKVGLLPLTGFLRASELQDARATLIRMVQSQTFASEIGLIKQKKSLPKRSPLSKLNPIITDYDGILRVGGRLSQSKLPSTEKHPPILPKSSVLSKLFIRYAHVTSLHGGPTLTCSILIQHAWVLGRRQLVKSVIRTCVKCQRVKPRLAQQLMGELPAARVTPARPFTTTGLDYAGPFQVRMSKGRGNRACKGYIALFVCFTTRAIHLELVSDLTSETFIAAYRRFVSRRGMCRTLYSDNATTFRGADVELKAMFNAASNFYKTAAATIANDGCSWIFIPPTTPHYGGIWEAGVKSTKYHLIRAFGNQTLTYEEFSTALTEIEACLNSRPLSPMSSDIDDLTVLTPAHFLLGETSGLVPDEDLSSLSENRLSRYQLTERIRNKFWVQWSREYLQYLQERTKWRNSRDNFKVGQLVILRDDRYPPAKWPLGRITAVHPGPDKHVRVVTVKTATSSFRRHVARLSPLFLEASKEQDKESGGTEEDT